MLRRLLILSLLCPFLLFAGKADDTTSSVLNDSIRYWDIKNQFDFHFTQTYFSNWSSGGESSVAGKIDYGLDADFEKGDATFNTNVDFQYGMMGFLGQTEKDYIQKTNDKIDIYTKVGYKAWEKFYYSTLIQVKTQFAPGYKYPNDSVVISRFFAPGYLTVSFGMDYKPIKNLFMFLSPASGKFTFVMDQELADQGRFGVTPAVIDDSTGQVLVRGKNLKPEFGVNFLLRFEKELVKNVKFKSKLNLYNNYLDEDEVNRWNIDVDFESSLSYLINKHFSTRLYAHLIYDHDVALPRYEWDNGTKVKVGEGPALQFKESLGIGFSFKF